MLSSETCRAPQAGASRFEEKRAKTPCFHRYPPSKQPEQPQSHDSQDKDTDLSPILWPAQDEGRDVAAPWVLALDGNGTLWDPSQDSSLRVPKLRDYLADRYPGLASAGGVEEQEALGRTRLTSATEEP